MMLDCDLLRQYVEAGSEDAFADLLGRHLDLVYSAALRQVNGDAHLAQDVAQAVFTELARKAGILSKRKSIMGCLYTCTHFTATKMIRTESRRRTREQQAESLAPPQNADDPQLQWEEIRPVLDRAMHELNAFDREAILLRYFEDHPLTEIGNRFGLSEDAARKRVERALVRLRALLSKTGITTASNLAAVLSSHAVQMAPERLAATLTGTALAAVSTTTGSGLTFLKIITMTKLKASIVGVVVAGGIATPLILEHQTKVENQALRQQLAQLAQLQAENDRLSNLVAQATSSQQRHNDEVTELIRLRGEVGRLRAQTNDLAKLQDENQRLHSVLAAGGGKKVDASAMAQERFPRESWNFAGYADPESAFKSVVWAMSNGDATTLLASLAPDGPEYKRFSQKSPEEIQNEARQEMERVKAFRILDKEVLSDNEVILSVLAEGINESGRFRIVRIGNDWKFSSPMKHGDTASNR